MNGNFNLNGELHNIGHLREYGDPYGTFSHPQGLGYNFGVRFGNQPILLQERINQMNMPNVDYAHPYQIRTYIQYLTQFRNTVEGRKRMIEFLRNLVDARPGQFNQDIQRLNEFQVYPRETIDKLIRASNRQESLAGVELPHTTDIPLPYIQTSAAAATEGNTYLGQRLHDEPPRGGRRRRITKSRRKHSRKSLRRRRCV
jgi:hypothetical protein